MKCALKKKKKQKKLLSSVYPDGKLYAAVSSLTSRHRRVKKAPTGSEIYAVSEGR